MTEKKDNGLLATGCLVWLVAVGILGGVAILVLLVRLIMWAITG